ncbi:MAG: DUF4974 domain-containing protein [Flavobacteriales bacterium]|nr:DUF4974 domain-containing protein [Flavobacteriales bacterium]
MSEELENIDQISKYLSGEMGVDEIRVFESWLEASDVNKKQFDEFKRIWNEVESHSAAQKIDVDLEWNIAQRNLNVQEEKNETHISTGKPKNNFLKIAAVIITLVAGAYFLNIYLKSSTFEEIVALEETVQQELPDGSNITLNENSSLIYTKKEFGSLNRNVILEGEGFFDIKRDEEKPFTISVNDYVVKVLGTSFFVNGSSTDSLVVMVQTGKVAVYESGKEDQVVYLKAGDKGVFKAEKNKVVKSTKDDKNDFAWKTKKLSFKKKKLSKVIRKLNRLYDCNIVIENKSLEDCRLTATFDKQPLDQVIKVIESTLGITAIKEDDRIVLKGEGC